MSHWKFEVLFKQYLFDADTIIVVVKYKYA